MQNTQPKLEIQTPVSAYQLKLMYAYLKGQLDVKYHEKSYEKVHLFVAKRCYNDFIAVFKEQLQELELDTELVGLTASKIISHVQD